MCASDIDGSMPNRIVPAGLLPYINDANPYHSFTLNGETQWAQPVVGGTDPVVTTPDGTTITGFARPNYAHQRNRDTHEFRPTTDIQAISNCACQRPMQGHSTVIKLAPLAVAA